MSKQPPSPFPTAALTNPYVGPRPFTTAEGDLFFGREREANSLIPLFMAQRLVLFYAQSGAGKSSLINTRLIPALRRRNFVVLPVGRLTGSPLEGVHPENIFTYHLLGSLSQDILDRDTLARMTISEYLGSLEIADPSADSSKGKEQAANLAAFANKPGPEPLPLDTPDSLSEVRPVALIIDQFEEIFTAHPAAWGQRGAFFEQLSQAFEADPYLWILLSMREDYLAGIDPYAHLLPNRMRARYYMERMGGEAALEAVMQPALRSGRSFTPEAADRLVKKLRQVVRGGEKQVGELELGQYVEPVQLQVVCQDLWEQMPASAEKIIVEDVERLVNVENALGRYYDRVLQKAAREDVSLGPGMEMTPIPAVIIDKDLERGIRDWIEFELISLAGTRSQVLAGERETQGLPNLVIEKLASDYLVRKEYRLGSLGYELAHDRLIEPVRNSNAAWREENLELFQRRALQWEYQGRSQALLLSPAELHQAEEFISTFPTRLTAIEEHFLDQSRAANRKAADAQQLRVIQKVNLEDLGWGVIFPANGNPAVREALRPLLDLRRGQAGAKEPAFYHEFERGEGYRPGETYREFLSRHYAGVTLAQPDTMPYYLLIVGDPEEIPFEFQYGLDLQYAVGRIHFDDLPSYTRYARSVVACETGQVALPRTAAFFTPMMWKFEATTRMVHYLVEPLLVKLRAIFPTWAFLEVREKEATRQNLAGLAGGPETPAFLFTGSLAVTLEKSDALLLSDVGAIVCQDYQYGRPLQRGDYFSARDVLPDACLIGSCIFLMSSFTAGAPKKPEFKSEGKRETSQLAEKSFLSALPKRLLSHPLGGALGVIGHVDNLWTSSFGWGNVRETVIFEDALQRLFSGHTFGSALEPFNQRYAILSSEVAEKMREYYINMQLNGKAPENWDPNMVDNYDRAAIDARNYILIGDPAARLPLVEKDGEVKRPTIEPVAEHEVPPL